MAALLIGAAMSGRSVSPVTWYVARASGIMLYLVLWLSAIGGLGLTTALMDRAAGRGVVFSLHAFTTPLAYGFLALHLLSIAADPTVDFGLKGLLVPFASPWREPWTGFGVLAAELTRLSGVPAAPLALQRRKATRRQVGLTAAQRYRNVAGAFRVPEAHRAGIAGKRVVLVDDVITTGATVEACARALRQAGALRVDALALALVVDPADMSA